MKNGPPRSFPPPVIWGWVRVWGSLCALVPVAAVTAAAPAALCRSLCVVSATPAIQGPIGSERVVRGAPLVERAALDSMVPLLDGRRTTEEIFGVLLNSGFELEPVFGAYNFLEDRGLLIEALVDDGLTHEERTRYARQMTEFSEFPLAWRPSTSTETLPDWGLQAQLSLRPRT